MFEGFLKNGRAAADRSFVEQMECSFTEVRWGWIIKGGDLVKDHVDSQQLDIYKHEYNSTIREATVPPASGFGKQSVCVGGGTEWERSRELA